MRDLFARPDSLVFGSESAAAALVRFGGAVDRVIQESSGDPVIVSHGTVIALFVAARAGMDATELWAKLGLPSYVSLELPEYRITELAAAI